MIIYDTPATALAQGPCNDLAPTDMHVMCSSVLRSPNRRWVIAIRGEDQAAPTVHLKQRLVDDKAVVADARTGRTVATFDMERSATVYWLKDNKTLIVNYFAGSDSTRPLAIRLDSTAARKPLDLSKLVYPDILKRIQKHPSQVYHYYVNFVADHGDRITIAASPDFVKHGEEGEGDGRCYLYSVDKMTFRHYRFVKELPNDCSGDI